MKDFRKLELRVDCDTNEITSDGDTGFYFGDNNSLAVALDNLPQEQEAPVRVLIDAILPGGGLVSQSALIAEGACSFPDLDPWLVKAGTVKCQLTIISEEETPVVITQGDFSFESFIKYGIGDDEALDSVSTDVVAWEDLYKAKKEIENISESISATVSENEDGALITVKDQHGTTTAQINNGKDGEAGKDGNPGPAGPAGEDGFSPIANVVKDGDDTIITITDKTGTTTATIKTSSYDDTQIRQLIANTAEALEIETGLRVAGDTALQTQIDNLEIPEKTSDLINDSGYITNAALAGYATEQELTQEIADTKALIPTKTSDLTNDSNYVVDANYNHTDNNYTSSEKTKLAGIEAGAEANVQSDWSETDNTSDAYIANKPTIPTKTSDLTNDGEGGTLKFKLASPGDAGMAVVTTNISVYNTNGDYVLVNKTSTPNVITLSDSTMSGTSIQIPTIDYINSLNANSTQY